MKENSNGENENEKDKSYYSQLKLNFTETVNWITSQSEVEEFKKLMDEFVSQIKNKYKNVYSIDTNQSYVSSNLPIETSKKHHRCMG